MSENKKFFKWRNVGFMEFSKSGKSLRIWISRKFKVEYCYVGLESLRKLLDGKKKHVSLYVLGDDSKP